MRRFVTLMAVLLAILTGSLSTISTISAQTDDATPSTEASSGAVTIFGPNGEPAAEIVVDALIDPFEDFDPSISPQRGFHYVMAAVTMTAGDAPFEASAYSFSLVDTEGFVYTTTFAYRSTEDTEAMPDFPGGTIEPGDSLSGVVFFEVLDGTTTGFLIYQPTFETLVTIADLRDEPVAQGDPVEYISSNNQPVATITVEGVVSPLEDYDPSYAPERGFEYAGVEVTIENTGADPLPVDPYSFQLVDAQSFIFYSTGILRTEESEAEIPSLQSEEIAPGDSVTGLVAFQVLTGTEIGSDPVQPVLRTPDPPGRVQRRPGADSLRLDRYDPDQPEHRRMTPPRMSMRRRKSEETPVPQASDEECEPVLEWGESTIQNVDALNAAYEVVSPGLSGDELDSAALRDAADAINEAGDDQDAIDTPELAEGAQEAFITLLDDAAETLNDLADAVDAGDDTAVSDLVDEFFSLGTEDGPGSLNQTFNDLAEACPALEEIGRRSRVTSLHANRATRLPFPLIIRERESGVIPDPVNPDRFPTAACSPFPLVVGGGGPLGAVGG